MTNTTKKEKLKILFASANPARDLSLDEEHRAIIEAIKSTPYSEYIEVVTRLACQYNDFIDAMNDEKPDIVHFSGHGVGKKGLVFAKPNSDTKIKINEDTEQSEEIGIQLVSAQVLRNIFATADKNLKLVVLNACLSETQAKEISQEIDFVIGMSDLIRDKTAIVFARRLYQSLASDKSIQYSFAQAKTQVLLEAPDEDETPVIFVKNDEVEDIKISDIVDKNANSKSGDTNTLTVDTIYGVGIQTGGTVTQTINNNDKK